MILSDDPAPGTERLHVSICQICGASHMSRTGLCDACQRECMEIGKAFRLIETRECVKEVIVNGIKIERMS